MNDIDYKNNIDNLIKYYLNENGKKIDVDRHRVVYSTGSSGSNGEMPVIDVWNWNIPQPTEQILRAYDLNLVNSFIDKDGQKKQKVKVPFVDNITDYNGKKGLLVFDTSLSKLRIHDGVDWLTL